MISKIIGSHVVPIGSVRVSVLVDPFDGISHKFPYKQMKIFPRSIDCLKEF